MPFLIALILIFLIQWLHLRLLRLELPEGVHRALPWGLGLLHLPLVIFAGMRVAGLGGGHGALALVQTSARVAFYFQAFTVLHLVIAMLADGLWRILRRDLPPAEDSDVEDEAAVDPGRRAFLRTAALASTVWAVPERPTGIRGSPAGRCHSPTFPRAWTDFAWPKSPTFTRVPSSVRAPCAAGGS